jgi:GNAT superfamily N-acetyltransferase
VNKQDGSTSCPESCAPRPDQVSNIVRKTIECEFPWFDQCDPLVVERTFSEVRVFYVCATTSSSGQRTFVDCRLHFDSHQMWIGSIQVAACHRLQGVGRQLVRAVEAIANALGMEELRILPTPSSVEFWRKLHYLPDPRSARVLWKKLVSVAENQAGRGGESVCTGRSSAETINISIARPG